MAVMFVGFPEAPVGGNDSFTKLLLHCDGADGSTTFTDSSASAHVVTHTGSAQIDTAQSKFGTGSLSCPDDASASYIALDGSSDFTFGTGDLTVDFWFRWHDNGGGISAAFELFFTAASGSLILIELLTDATVLFYFNGASRTSAMLTADTWYHLAVSRSGTSSRAFLNGTQVGTTVGDSSNYGAGGAGYPPIGRTFAASPGVDIWLDEFRVSKGIARWTANFTPPTAAYSTP